MRRHAAWLAILLTHVAAAQPLTPKYDGVDSKRARIAIKLTEVASGLEQPTDIQFVPQQKQHAVITQKGGQAIWIDLAKGKRHPIVSLSVPTASEQGLLGFAFHPRFPKKPLVYLNYTVKRAKGNASRLSEWRWPRDPSKGSLTKERILMEVEQPYRNHNAGQIAFGVDGFLYVGWGDGGSANDPLNHGQNPATLLGSMLRIDVDRPARGKPYGIPRGNPFIGRQGYAPEAWAIGLRNPWRFSFDRRGRLIVADVGQNTLEEISIVSRGKNYGWRLMEGDRCFNPPKDCAKDRDLVEPILTYGRSAGVSITGGYQYLGRSKKLKELYIFGDFASGRIWAIKLPTAGSVKSSEWWTLGRWPIAISTFGRDSEGEIYVADFTGGKIYGVRH